MKLNLKQTLMGVTMLAGTAFISTEAAKYATNQKTLTETVYDSAKERIETEKAIKAEGIQAKSYAEAKMKLDSIENVRLYQKYGITPPNADDTSVDSVCKESKLIIAMMHEITENNIKNTKKIIFYLECLEYGIDPNHPDAKLLVDMCKKEEALQKQEAADAVKK